MDNISPASRLAEVQRQREQREIDDTADLVRCGRRYRLLRALAFDPRNGLESFVAINLLDHMRTTEEFDAVVDQAMMESTA